MHTYICTDGKRKRSINSKHELNLGNIICGRGKVYTVISKKGAICYTDTKSAITVAQEHVQSALLLAEHHRRRLQEQQ